MGRRGRTWAITTAVLAALGDAASARANSTGMAGHSGKQGGICNACHSGGTAPTVAFSGPDTVAVGATVTYHFSVESARAAQRAAGFNVAVSGGQLAILPDQGEHLIGAELTHTAPKRNTDNLAGWDFTWTAPTTTGPATLFGAGNSVNLNGQNSGDRASATIFAVMVIEAVTPTPTATPVPPTATAGSTNTPVATRTRAATFTPGGPCAGDCNGGGTVTVNELVLGVGIALGTSGTDACIAMDGNTDGQVAISELIAAVASLLDGCP
jgi:hypothetical protein